MYERCLNEAERILAADKDIIVPVKKVWMEVKKQGEEQRFDIPSLADLTAMMEGDSRFEFMSAREDLDPQDDEWDEESGDIDRSDLEHLGFYSGDRVKLRRIQLSPEIIGGVIRRKVDLTMEALTKAWEMRPTDDQETEGQLLEIMSKTQKLQRDIQQSFSEEKMKALSGTPQHQDQESQIGSRQLKKSSALSSSKKKISVTKKKGSGKKKKGGRG